MIGAVLFTGLTSTKLPYTLEYLSSIGWCMYKYRNKLLCHLARDVIINTNFRPVILPDEYLGRPILFIHFNNNDVYKNHKDLLLLDESVVLPRDHPSNGIWESLHE